MTSLPAAVNSDSLKAYKEKALADFHSTSGFLHSKRIEIGEKYIDPATKYAQEKQRERPIAVALLALFFATSFFPVLGFLLFSLGSVLVIFLIALFWVAVFVGLAGLILTGTLIVTGAFSLTCVFWGLIAYAGIRLVTCALNGTTLVEGLQMVNITGEQTFREEMNALLIGGGGIGGAKVNGTKVYDDDDVKVKI